MHAEKSPTDFSFFFRTFQEMEAPLQAPIKEESDTPPPLPMKMDINTPVPIKMEVNPPIPPLPMKMEVNPSVPIKTEISIDTLPPGNISKTVEQQKEITPINPQPDLKNSISMVSPNFTYTMRNTMLKLPKKYECTLCFKAFADNYKLVVHTRTHTGERPYKCETCPKAFARSDKLLLHRRIHTGEKPYVCNYCLKAFTRSDKLSQHKKSHIFGIIPPYTPETKQEPV